MVKQAVKGLGYFLQKTKKHSTKNNYKNKPNLAKNISSEKWRNLITTLTLTTSILIICKKCLYSPLDLACHQQPEQIEK